ncbi:hypothetical protein FSP39_005398 [Pinctada imbricata]|uniref:Uncharacterized protein n=1 Tax=Pinctada imbricata TaxID=66713 RepID=A0AA88XJB7_PINIB|nr:hypothetical protein FSP39_005398 [Pinctada imbricata]
MADHSHVDQGEHDGQSDNGDIGPIIGESSCDDIKRGNSVMLDEENSFHGNDATDSADGMTATSSNSTNPDPMSIDSDEQHSGGEELDCSTSHIPLNKNLSDLMTYECASPELPSSRVVPTPVSHTNELTVPIEDFTNTQEHIKERKYPVLPSIGQRSKTLLSSCGSEHTDINDNSSTINQLDFTRERMEVEADFFADYRINTSKVKVTPRQNPLPPIRQTSSLSSQRGKR